ncbi:MAG: glycine cleavage T C-terminal barrel domain-containing protein [Polyangiaceae bacterium]|jgi:folate-binding protein YgfZ
MSRPFAPWRWLDDPATVTTTADRVLRVEGGGSRNWLNSLLTADLRRVAPGTAGYALLLTPTGGIVTDAWVVDTGSQRSEAWALVLPAARAERASEALEKYLLNEAVTLTLDDTVRVVAIHGARGGELLEGAAGILKAYSCARLGPIGLDVWVPTAAVDGVVTRLSAAAYRLGGGAVGALDWSSARVALGVPQMGSDFDENLSPHEAGLEGRAVSFAKGCYLGQERVARQQRQGGLARRLVQLVVEGAERVAEGSIVCSPGGEEVGRVTSLAPASDEYRNVLALAGVTPNFAEPGTRLTVVERAAQVRLVIGRSEPSLPPGIGRPPDE